MKTFQKEESQGTETGGQECTSLKANAVPFYCVPVCHQQV